MVSSSLIECALKLRETFDGAQLRVGFGERENLAQSLRQHAFGFGFRGGALGIHGGIAGLNYAFEGTFFMAGVAFYSFD